MSVIEEIRNDVAGAKLLADWLGDGGFSVPASQADWRASVCSAGNLGQPCEMNVEPRWWERVKNDVADAIKAELEIRNRIGLTVKHEESIFMCRGCGCCLKLKVHTPIEHIAKHTPKSQIDKMPPFCWIKKELSRL